MATLIHPTESFDIPAPTTLREFRALVGGYPEFVRFDDGSVFVRSETSPADEPVNRIASGLSALKGRSAEYKGRVVFLPASEARSVLPVTP